MFSLYSILSERATDPVVCPSRLGDYQLNQVGHLVRSLGTVYPASSLYAFMFVSCLLTFSNAQIGINSFVREQLNLCPSTVDTKASREWEIITGCSNDAVPMERSISASSNVAQCTFWDEECMQDELMTTIISEHHLLSRVTIATLEDIGYQVDYDQADSYSLRDINPACACNRRLRQSSDLTRSKRRKLSDEGREGAIRHGRSLIQDNMIALALNKDEEHVEGHSDYRAGNTAVVYYLEEGELFSVPVSV